VLCICGFIPYGYAQKENPDSVLNANMTALTKPDNIYFEGLKAKMQNDMKQARELFEQFVALRPQVSAGYYELSKLYYNDKKPDKAEANIKKAISIDPGNKWYKEQYASILAENGNFIDAADIIAGLCKSEPSDEEYPKMAAEYFERAKKYEDAAKYLDIALTYDPDDEELQSHKVQLFLEMNNTDKAAEVINHLLAKDPHNGRYYKWLGDLYDVNKMPQKAAEVYDKAQRALPDDPQVQIGLAGHFLNMGDTARYITNIEKAIVNPDLDAQAQMDQVGVYIQTLPNDSVVRSHGLLMLQRIAAQHPADPQVLSVYGEFLDWNNKRDSAVWAYKKSLDVKPGDFDTWKKLLDDYTDKQSADSLIKYTEKAIRLFPNQAIVSYYSAIGYSNKKDYTRAIKAVNRAIDIQPENNKPAIAEMYALLADIYHSTKQDELSDNAFEKGLSLDPMNSGILNNYSYYLSERGKKLEEAEKLSKRSLDIRPSEPTYLDTYGWIEYKKGDYEKAKTFVQKAIDLAGQNADATLYDHLGDIYFKLNNKDKAAEYWKKSKEKGGDDPQLDKKISEGKLYE
jgi:tetratricopeptide (TPR) repeat protein